MPGVKVRATGTKFADPGNNVEAHRAKYWAPGTKFVALRAIFDALPLGAKFGALRIKF